ncbi:MAG: RNA polymerase sigma-70 factor [bacterium]|nr:RNA polymerase sigma-70 factor [bacterium]
MGEVVNSSEKLIELVNDIKRSDPDAFKQLYYSYYNKLYSYLCYRTSSAYVSKDLIQDVFTRVWTNRESLDPAQSISAYLYRIAANLVVDHFRKMAVEKKHFSDKMPEDIDSKESDQYEIRDLVTKLLDGLPEDERTVFIMNRYEGYKQREIAEVLDVSVKTVENRIGKVLSYLRENAKKKM